MSVVDGRLYHCVRQVWLVFKGIEPESSEDLVNLFDPQKSRAAIRDQIVGLYQKQAFLTCEYCLGLHDDAPRLKPAVQMTREEQLMTWRLNHE